MKHNEQQNIGYAQNGELPLWLNQSYIRTMSCRRLDVLSQVYRFFQMTRRPTPALRLGAAQQLPAATERYAFRGGNEIGRKQQT